jgi:hypothetical protein
VPSSSHRAPRLHLRLPLLRTKISTPGLSRGRRDFLQLTISNDSYPHEFIGLASAGPYLA